ncbi:CPBP family intramembrane glutamic endopeptidase [Paenibacillus sediminis]|uniref:Membrane protease YdiL (CAAX protease family) n=1 Tax=Paenibacillus sediminis TaxID=664909 RepID=A0ABS4GZN5_9BACL|nr:CPBP family intramembrane glutamic endopeptidase [Paenibacillus sediminis]MBP1935729.1 membrane protease YdiL (CAAX protease family) [Paenibacillus sediminis]
MKKSKLRNIKIRQVTVDQLNDRLLLTNLYLTQGLTLIIGLMWVLLQKRNVFHLLVIPSNYHFIYWGLSLAVIMLIVDFFISRVVPEDIMNDGGINEMLFRHRPVWHILIIALVVAICEELLFRGAVQYAIGPYWTSIVFALIHVRYLKHWIPTGWVFLSSYGLGYIYIQSGTLWAPIVCHFLIDLISGLIIRFRREHESVSK